MSEHDRLSAVMRLVRERVAEHRRTRRPVRCPTAARKSSHTTGSAAEQDVVQHVEASCCALPVRRASLLDGATRRVERRRTLQVRSRILDPRQAVVMEMSENCRQRASFALVFPSALTRQAFGSRCSSRSRSCDHLLRKFPAELRKLQIWIGRSDEPCWRKQPPYFLAACASIFSITNALDPPRS